MENLIRIVSAKVGLSETQARQAIEIVVNFLKNKLPAPLARQIDFILDNQRARPQDANIYLFGTGMGLFDR
ncbi:MAG: hypothetical protein KC419_16825 [Anaerolineales bacterium]|nr:hypothetical protein [Anaerolineales bacterium]MCA9930150.1 hypothetical protein [Anaerolineales bacterium]